MPATIDATPGGASANAYCTLAEADEFCDTHPYTVAWDAASDDLKNRAIITATRLINQRMEWYGSVSTEEQALPVPRVGLYDRNGNAVPDDEVPVGVKDGTADFARLLLEHDYTADNAPGRDGLKRVKAGAVEVEYRDGLSIMSGKMIPDSVWSELETFGTMTERGRAATAALSRV